jgi:hypothetical protein
MKPSTNGRYFHNLVNTSSRDELGIFVSANTLEGVRENRLGQKIRFPPGVLAFRIVFQTRYRFQETAAPNELHRRKNFGMGFAKHVGALQFRVLASDVK